MGFLVITFSNMLSFVPIANLAFSAMALAAVSTLAISMLVSLAAGMTRAPYSAEFAGTRRECNHALGVDLDGRLVYATDRNQDLIFWMDAWLSC